MSDEPLIMVVDDDDDLRDTLVEALQMVGYSVSGKRDGIEALEALRADARPDLILLDLMMPRMTGWEVYEAMSAMPALADLPVLIMTAMRSADSQRAPAGLDTIQKPFALQGLLERVERRLESTGKKAVAL
jgi:CheY-like chemotaxis protein